MKFERLVSSSSTSVAVFLFLVVSNLLCVTADGTLLLSKSRFSRAVDITDRDNPQDPVKRNGTRPKDSFNGDPSNNLNTTTSSPEGVTATSDIKTTSVQPTTSTSNDSLTTKRDNGNVSTPLTNANGVSPNCHLHPRNHLNQPTVYDQIKTAVLAQNSKLIQYTLHFPDYDSNPLAIQHTERYQMHVWQRLLDQHGESLLNLVFNYDVLSLKMLTFRTETFTIELVDTPPKCFQTLTADEMYNMVLELILHDFNIDTTKEPHSYLENELWQSKENRACHQVIRTNNDTQNSEFVYRCCKRNKLSPTPECADQLPAEWAIVMYNLLSLLKVLFWLFGPMLLYMFVLKDTVLSLNYSLDLSGWFERKVRVENDPSFRNDFERCKRNYLSQDGLHQYTDLKSSLGSANKCSMLKVAGGTSLPIQEDTMFPIKEDSRHLIKEGARLPIKEGTPIPIKKGAQIPIQEGSTLQFGDEEFCITNGAKLALTDGATLLFEKDTALSIHLSDTASGEGVSTLQVNGGKRYASLFLKNGASLHLHDETMCIKKDTVLLLEDVDNLLMNGGYYLWKDKANVGIKSGATLQIAKEATVLAIVEDSSVLEDDNSAVFPIKELKLCVKHTKLLTESDVPAGLLNYIYRNVVLCGIRSVNPFFACCKQTICGSWDGFFLWKGIGGKEGDVRQTMKEYNSNELLKSLCSWNSLSHLLGALFTFLLIPVPYYIRLWCYYEWEYDEAEARKEALSHLNLSTIYTPEKQMIQYFGPLHPIYVTIYVSYIAIAIILFFIRLSDPNHFDADILDCLNDLKTLNRTTCIRLLLSHALLPLEKFGIVGCCLNVIYLIIALPLCLIVIVIYCIPTFYFTFRMFLPKRVRWLQIPFHQLPTYCCKRKRTECKHEGDKTRCGCCGQRSQATNQCTHEMSCEEYLTYLESERMHVLSGGTENIESALLLEDISPNPSTMVPKYHLAHLWKRYKEKEDRNDGLNRKTLVGLMCAESLRRVLVVAWVYCFLMIYAECFVYLVHMLVLTAMGTIVNADVAGKFMILCFYALGYAAKCYGDSYEKYVKLNKAIFSHIKGKLGDSIRATALKPRSQQGNNAFSFYTEKELNKLFAQFQNIAPNCSSNNDQYEGTVKLTETSANIDLSRKQQPTVDKLYLPNADHFLTKRAEVFWHSNNLVMFLDDEDTPRIPEKLFFAMTQFEAPGCPGPIYKSLLQATYDLFKLIIFLCFVIIVVISFSSVYKVSTSNQMLATVAGGLLPFIIRSVLNTSTGLIDLDSYRFEGQIHEILSKYHQKWPVHDIILSKNQLGLKKLWRDVARHGGGCTGGMKLVFEEPLDDIMTGKLQGAALGRSRPIGGIVQSSYGNNNGTGELIALGMVTSIGLDAHDSAPAQPAGNNTNQANSSGEEMIVAQTASSLSGQPPTQTSPTAGTARGERTDNGVDDGKVHIYCLWRQLSAKAGVNPDLQMEIFASKKYKSNYFKEMKNKQQDQTTSRRIQNLGESVFSREDDA